MDTSEEDLALIHALQIVPRVSWADAARILDSHPTALSTRWDRLSRSGRAWVGASAIGTGMDMTLAFVEVDWDSTRRGEIIAAVSATPEVVSVEVSARNRDLLLTVVATSLAELGQTLLPSLAAIPGVSKLQTTVCTRLHAGGESWRLSALSKAQQSAFQALVPHEEVTGALDDSYRPMLHALFREARASAADLARETAVHPTTASRRLNRIMGSGLLSFRCEIAQGSSGYPVTCQWFGNVPPGEHESAAEALQSIRNVRLCASTSGRTNFTIVMWLQSVAEVLTAELAITKRIPSIELLESSLTLNFVKRVGWMLNPDGTTTGECILPKLPEVLSVHQRWGQVAPASKAIAHRCNEKRAATRR